MLCVGAFASAGILLALFKHPLLAPLLIRPLIGPSDQGSDQALYEQAPWDSNPQPAD